MSIARTLKTRIGPRSAGVAMTAEEFDQLPESRWVPGYRYELINGVLIVSPPVSDAEAEPNDELGHLLRSYKEFHPQGAALDATMPERTVPGTAQRRRADRVAWTGLGRDPRTSVDVPSIVVEFVSRSRRDRVRDYEERLREYRAAGVLEYWIIDRFRGVMTVHREAPNGPETLVMSAGEIHRTELLPGFELPVARILASALRWDPKARTRKPPAGGNS